MEEVRANYPAQGRIMAMRQCLASIDQRLQQLREQEEQQRLTAEQQAAPSDDGPSDRDRFIYCRLHQSEIQAAERERQKLQSIWTVASTEQEAGSAAYEEAREAYEDSVAELDRLIPENMRMGKPLIPDAISRFMACDPNQI